jgi:hypothetical protein
MNRRGLWRRLAFSARWHLGVDGSFSALTLKSRLFFSALTLESGLSFSALILESGLVFSAFILESRLVFFALRCLRVGWSFPGWVTRLPPSSSSRFVVTLSASSAPFYGLSLCATLPWQWVPSGACLLRLSARSPYVLGAYCSLGLLHGTYTCSMGS